MYKLRVKVNQMKQKREMIRPISQMSMPAKFLRVNLCQNVRPNSALHEK